MMPLWYSSERAEGPPMRRRQSVKHLKREARKEESCSVLMQLIIWWKMAETIWGVREPLCLPQERSMGASLKS
jgi:hypothetical protein